MCLAMLWHCVLMAVSTLAAGRYQHLAISQTCTDRPVCATVDPLVAPLHALLPLALCVATLVVLDAPGVLLASSGRVRCIQEATVRCLTVVPLLGLVAAAGGANPALVAAVCTHGAAHLMAQPAACGGWFGSLVRGAGVSALVGFVWSDGVPLPVIPAPGGSVCCGGYAHLAGVLACTMLLSPLQRGLRCLLRVE